MKITLNGFHKAFESRVRLGIMSVLAVNDSVDFNALKDYLGLTDGNLASHLKALENDAFIALTKTFVGRKPNTRYFITPLGQKAFKDHLKSLEQLIKTQK